MVLGYQASTVKEFKPQRFEPKQYTWMISGVGIILYIITAVFIFFGAVIVYFPGLRGPYLNWSVASVISGLLTYFLGKFLIQNYGVKYFYISSNAFSFLTPLGRTVAIPKSEIIHIRVNRPNPSLMMIPLFSPTIIVATYDKLYKFRTSRWLDQDELLSTFDDLSLTIRDDFAEYYHKSKTTLYSFMIRMSQDTAGIVGLTIIIVYLFMAIWGGLAMLIDPVGSYTPYTLFLRNPEFLNGALPDYTWEDSLFHPPNHDFWFGTDFIGRDIFARLVYGTTFTFMIALSGSLVSIIIVVTLGLSSAFFKGVWDTTVSRVADTLLTFPPFIPLILISTLATPIRLNVPGGYFLAVFLGMSLFTWPLGMRIIRSEVINLLNNEYIMASKQIGASSWYILRSHIIPKILPTILIIFTYTFTDIILGTTLLGFIGLDSESTLTWGSDLAKAVIYSPDIKGIWWTTLFPTMWIFLLVFGLTLFSDSIRDTLDPMLRGGINAVPYEFTKELEGLK